MSHVPPGSDGSLWVLWFPSTSQKYASRYIKFKVSPGFSGFLPLSEKNVRYAEFKISSGFCLVSFHFPKKTCQFVYRISGFPSFLPLAKNMPVGKLKDSKSLNLQGNVEFIETLKFI